MSLEAYGLSATNMHALWWRLGEDVVALEITEFLNYVFRAMWTLLRGAILGMKAIFVALLATPVFPQGSLLGGATLLLIISALWSLVIVVEMNRNDLLSRIEKSTPNRLDLDWRFLSQVSQYVLLPLLLVLGSQVGGLSAVARMGEQLLTFFK